MIKYKVQYPILLTCYDFVRDMNNKYWVKKINEREMYFKLENNILTLVSEKNEIQDLPIIYNTIRKLIQQKVIEEVDG